MKKKLSQADRREESEKLIEERNTQLRQVAFVVVGVAVLVAIAVTLVYAM